MGIAEYIIFGFFALWVLLYLFTAIDVRCLMLAERYLRRKSETANSPSPREHANAPGEAAALYYSLLPYVYGFMRYMNIRTCRIPSARLRRDMMRLVFRMNISKLTVIYGGSEFRSPWNITLGNCVVSNNCIFDGRAGIRVGDHTVFGGGVHLWTEEHAVNDPQFRVLPENRAPITIDDHCWICSDSTILPGCHIGEGAVVASRACVTKDCEPYGIYAGVPAKKIGERTRELEYRLSGKPTWHFY